MSKRKVAGKMGMSRQKFLQILNLRREELMVQEAET